MSHKLPISTSTPFSWSPDSGYHSNVSGQSKSCSIRTPDTCSSTFSDVSTVSAKHEKVDFLYHLGESSSYWPIVWQIFEHIDNEDLYNATRVSKTWKKVILSIPSLRKRWRLFTRKIELDKENRGAIRNGCCGSFEEKTPFSPRSMLTEIQNSTFQSINSSHSSSGTPARSPCSRYEAFRMEARRLKIGKRLYSCPKCKLPSQIDDERELQTAICTNQFCQYRFCILCDCEAHPTRVCSFISTPVVRKPASLVGSRSSRNNLKRLLY